MRPKKHETTGSGDLFRARLEQIINMKHELVLLAGKIEWQWIDSEIAPLYSDKGRPGIETRFVIGLLLLKGHRQWETDPSGTLNLTHRIRWFLREGGADAEGGGADGISGFEKARGQHPGAVAVDGTVAQHGSTVFARWR